jgi:hypothetical protein
MSKKHSSQPPPRASPIVVESKTTTVKHHLRCPCCFNGYGGTACKRKWQVQISGPLVKRSYLCGECGTEWIVEIRTEIEDGIEYKTTKVTEVHPSEQGQKAMNDGKQ